MNNSVKHLVDNRQLMCKKIFNHCSHVGIGVIITRENKVPPNSDINDLRKLTVLMCLVEVVRIQGMVVFIHRLI